MNSHRLKVALTENGKITLENLPFLAGETVEIIISPQKKVPCSDQPFPLEGTVNYYDDHA
ncbi:hypothetical protein [Crocosphaera sp.]|uniref:hypothetical protein n=1 Tax=Crocosphaera sp. TaxID=2729996 RepID=UPI00261423A1|nr:hypothetical protein [Crocosphaera sp.]MDJ0583286.1 hypothetical protein [Crocosphaera sp.]